MKIGKKLKAIRKKQKVTLKELSEKSGVQIATLSRMENDIMIGTLRAHMSICAALGIPLSDFYREVELESKNVSITRAQDKHETLVSPRSSTIEMLTTKVMEKRMMPVLVKIKKGGQTTKEENKVGAEKFIYIAEGKVHAKIGKQEHDLSKGDSIYFDASLPHSFSNTIKTDAHVLVVFSPPSL